VLQKQLRNVIQDFTSLKAFQTWEKINISAEKKEILKDFGVP
jgi:hypothetical protein